MKLTVTTAHRIITAGWKYPSPLVSRPIGLGSPVDPSPLISMRRLYPFQKIKTSPACRDCQFKGDRSETVDLRPYVLPLLTILTTLCHSLYGLSPRPSSRPIRRRLSANRYTAHPTTNQHPPITVRCFFFFLLSRDTGAHVNYIEIFIHTKFVL